MPNLVDVGYGYLRPLGALEIVGETLSIMVRRWFTFALPFLVFTLLENLLSFLFNIGRAGLAGSLLSLLLDLIFAALATGIVVQMAADEYLGKETDLSKSVGSALEVILSLIVASILVPLIIIVGIVLLIVPGIIFWIMFSVTIPVIVLERKGVLEALGRSRKLASKNWGHIFGALMVGIIVILLASFIRSLIVNILAFLLGRGLATLIAIFLSSIISPIYAILTTVLYFDLFARKSVAMVPPPIYPPTRPETVFKREELPKKPYKYCPYCGAEIPPGARFCPRCGAALEE